MNVAVDSALLGIGASTTEQAVAPGIQGGEFADYLTQAMQDDAVESVAAGGTDPLAAMQSMMSLMLMDGMGEGSNEFLSVILMYLLMGRDDNSLPQVQDAYLSGDTGGTQKAADTVPGFAQNNGIVQSALKRLGDPYSQAKAGRGDYTDCSYLTRWCYRAAGVELPRTAAAQAKHLEDSGQTVTKNELKPGDLIFYSFKENGRYKDISHVGIYAGNGKMVDASSANGQVVYRDMFEGAIAYARPEVPASGSQTI